MYKFGVFVKSNSYGIHIYIYIHILYTCSVYICIYTAYIPPAGLNDWKIFQLGDCLQLTGVNSLCSNTEMCSMGLEYLPTNLPQNSW